jgi:hypothetical protein
MEIVIAIWAAIAIALGAEFIWVVVRISNRGLRLGFLKNRKSVVTVIGALAFLAGGMIGRKYPTAAIITVVAGLGPAVAIARMKAVTHRGRNPDTPPE